MDFRRKVRRSTIKPTYHELLDVYPHDLQMFRTPPGMEIPYSELEECTADRLAVLQTIDDVTGRGLKGEDWRKAIVEEMKKQNLRGFCKLLTSTSCGSADEDFQMRKRDHVSHYMLRLAYCDTEEKRRWFTAKEVDLFRFRWIYLNSNAKAEFLKANNFDFDEVSESERAHLAEVSFGMVSTVGSYYKVPFITVSDLVKSRRVFLRDGFAYITIEDIVSVVISSYRSSLSHSLAYLSRRIHLLSENLRILMLIKGAGKSQREVTYSRDNKGRIDINNIDAYSELSFPLCMQQLHGHLRKEHHLRHSGRQQYGLFLKGIGVTLEDALLFWKKEFSKKMDPEKFEKSYSYNIRHNYGKEGKRANYAPMNCLKIINSVVGPGELHGCPFKCQDPVLLKATMTKNGVSAIGAQEVLDAVRKGHFQVACSKYFQLTHGIDTPVVVNHPNAYFDESQMYLTNKNVKKEEKPSGRSSLAAPSPGPKPPPSKQRVVDEWGDDSEMDFSSIDV